MFNDPIFDAKFGHRSRMQNKLIKQIITDINETYLLVMNFEEL